MKSEVESVDKIDAEFAKGLMKTVQKATGVKGKNLFMPARVALTGMVHGPEFVNILELLGRDRVINRIENVEAKYL